MSPEARLAEYAERIHLQDEDVGYLLSLLQEARALGSLAGSAAEREACAKLAETFGNSTEERESGEDIAVDIRARGAP